MRIVAIRATTVPLHAPVSNAAIRFDTMTASAVAVISDVVRHGRPLVGFGLDSIGRYGHTGLLSERFIPRLLAAAAQHYQDTAEIDPCRAWNAMMRNEKPGGHGERAGAVGVLDAALWDLAAKQADKPLWRLLAERFGDARRQQADVAVYASGGHYHQNDDIKILRTTLRQALDEGFTRCKIKIGGVALAADIRRIEAALTVLGSGAALAVDANASFDRAQAERYLQALTPYRLAWVEEPVDPLDYALHAELAAAFPMVNLATGENLFSYADVRNLLRYGGLRSQQDWLQMDISLSYGLPEYLRMLALAEAQGWTRTRFLPHAGHLFALHVVAGVGLGAHETALDAALPIAGFSSTMRLDGGHVWLGDAPGVGFEYHPRMYALLQPLLNGKT